MFKRMLVTTLAVGLAAWIVSSCGYTKKSTTSGATGSMVSFIGDAPFCGILSFRIAVTGMVLTHQGSSQIFTAFPVLSKNPNYKVNFGELRDFSTLLDINAVPVGTYDKIKLTFSSGQITVFDPTKNPPILVSNGSFTTTSPEVSIQPPLVITQGTLSGLRIELDLSRSITLDAQGQVTGGVKPFFTVTPITASVNQGFGEMDDMMGIVTSVNPAKSGSFQGGFGFASLSGSAPVVTASLVGATEVCGFTMPPDPPCGLVIPPKTTPPIPPTPPGIQLDKLLTDSVVDLEGFVDSVGNLVVNSMEVEDVEAPEKNQIAFVGDILSVTKDASGNATQFTLYVSSEEPDDSFQVPLDTTVVVNVSPTTVYQYSSRDTNFANLTVDPTALAPGQRVVASGIFTRPATVTPPLPTTVAADKVYVKLHSYQGNFSSLIAAQADDKTGGFWMSPCSALFGGAPILVLTGPQTTFVNGTGLSSLTPQPGLLVKGLMFFELQGQTVNGVSIPPGTLVLVAKQVHELQ